MHVMIDLETFGNAPGSVIVSIGAVTFDREKIHDTFYRRIDAQSCADAGLTLDPSTVMWWLMQSEAARAEIVKGGDDLLEVLASFACWLPKGDELEGVWGNGANFDNALMQAAYRAVKLPLPWKFWQDRCYRTTKNEHPEVPMRRTGTHHNALDDAQSQAEHLIAVWATRSGGWSSIRWEGNIGHATLDESAKQP